MPRSNVHENDIDDEVTYSPTSREDQPAVGDVDQIGDESKIDKPNTEREHPPRIRNPPRYLNDYIVEKDDEDCYDLAGYGTPLIFVIMYVFQKVTWRLYSPPSHNYDKRQWKMKWRL